MSIIESRRTYEDRAEAARGDLPELRRKARELPAHRSEYEMLHDQKLAEMYFYDAAARACTGSAEDMIRRLKSDSARICRGPRTTAFLERRLQICLEEMIDSFAARLEGDGASDPES